jgi:hypothetical protein
MAYLTFPQFQASKKAVADLAAAGIETGVDQPVPGFTYDDYCYISKCDGENVGQFHLVISNMDWMSGDLAGLERILWALHYLPEQGGDTLLDENDGTLDNFIQGMCAAHGKPVDGDYYGHAFSDTTRNSKWSVEDARDICVSGWKSELYTMEEM